MRTRRRRVVTLVQLAACSLCSWPAASASPRRRRIVPYYGKNRIRYDHFKWRIYTTDHFEIYYYPEIERHLERIACYAESAYQQVSSDLKHDLAFKVPLVLYKTESEFQQQNIDPGEHAGGGARASPSRTAIGWSCRSTNRPTRSIASSPTS